MADSLHLEHIEIYVNSVRVCGNFLEMLGRLSYLNALPVHLLRQVYDMNQSETKNTEAMPSAAPPIGRPLRGRPIGGAAEVGASVPVNGQSGRD